MNARQLYIMAAALIAALFAGILLKLRNAPDKLQLIADPQKAPLVNKLTIAQPGEPEIRLSLRDGAWHITEPVNIQADSERLKTLANALKYANISPELSRNPDDFASFGVSESSGIHFRAETPDGPLTEFTLGKENGGAYYILYNGAVSEGAGFPWVYLKAPPSDWADRTVTALATHTITDIEVKSEYGFATASKTPAGWIFDRKDEYKEKGIVPPAAVAEALSPAMTLLADLKADQILCAGPKCAAPAEKPVCVLTAAMPGRYYPLTLKFYKQRGEANPVVSSEKPDIVFSVSDIKTQTLCTLPDELNH